MVVAIAPLMVFLTVFLIVPAGYAMYLSLTRSMFLKVRSFAGLGHYLSIFTDWRSWADLRNSITFTFGSVLLCFVGGLFLAWIVNKDLKGRTLFRVILILPWVTNQVAFTMLVKWLMNTDFGLLNAVFQGVGLGKIDFLSSNQMAMVSLILSNSWRMVGYALIFSLASIQTVPNELIEAASVDGATPLQVKTRIILPYLKPQLLVILVLLTLQNFNVLTPVMVLTGGGPGVATETLGLRMYREAFVNYALDRSAAYAVIILLLNVVFAAVYARIIPSHE